MGLPVSEINEELTIDEYVERQQQLAEETFQLVREHLSRNAQRRKSTYDAKVRQQTYDVGEAVWYYYPRRKRSRLSGNDAILDPTESRLCCRQSST